MSTGISSFFSQGQGLLIVGGVLLLGATAMVILTLGRLVGAGGNRKGASGLLRKKQTGLAQRLILFLLAAVFFFMSLSILLTGAALRTYTAFTREEPVAMVECLKWDPIDKTMIVRFTEIRQGEPAGSRTLTLYGDEWAVNARILKWTPKANLFGRHTAYRLNMIRGAYSDAADETSKRHQAYALNPGTDWAWEMVRRIGKNLPMVDAVYGNAVSQTARMGEVHDIFVTTSGLIARPKE